MGVSLYSQNQVMNIDSRLSNEHYDTLNKYNNMADTYTHEAGGNYYLYHLTNDINYYYIYQFYSQQGNYYRGLVNNEFNRIKDLNKEMSYYEGIRNISFVSSVVLFLDYFVLSKINKKQKKVEILTTNSGIKFVKRF